MKTALILGVDGQDGSYLAELLLSKKYRVIGWVPDSIPVSYTNIEQIFDQLIIVKGSLLDQEGLNSLLESYRPDEIYNLASPSLPAKSWDDPVHSGNVTALGPARLLEAIRLICPETRFYQASSSELFGNPLEVPQNENTPYNPRNPYGIAKLHAYLLTRNYRKKYGLFTVSGILYNHESPRRGLDFVTRKITHGAANIKLGLEDKLQLGNLNARRDWGYAGDYVRAMWLMLQQDKPDDYVIGTGKDHSVRDFCEVAFNYLDLDYQDYAIKAPEFYRPVEDNCLIADSSKAREELNWKTTIKFRGLVELMVENDLNSLSG